MKTYSQNKGSLNLVNAYKQKQEENATSLTKSVRSTASQHFTFSLKQIA